MICDRFGEAFKTNPIAQVVGLSDWPAGTSPWSCRRRNSIGWTSAKRVFSPSTMSDPDADKPRVKTNPTKPHRPHRLWRWAFRIVAFGCVLLGIAAIGIHLALPSIVRQQVHDALARAGYPNANFTIEQ